MVDRPQQVVIGGLVAAAVGLVMTLQPQEARSATPRAQEGQRVVPTLAGLGLGGVVLARRSERRALGAAALVLCGGLVGCDASQAAAPLERVGGVTRFERGRVILGERALNYVKVEAATNTPEEAAIRAPARMVFRDNAMSSVDTPAPGRVKQLFVNVGSKVEAGAPLATVVSGQASQLRLERERTQLRVKAASAALARQNDMMKSGVGREQDRRAAQFELERATAAERHAARALAMLGKSKGAEVTVVAPIGGTVLARRATVGTQVTPEGEPMFEIGDPSALWVVAEVFQDDLAQVRLGASVNLEFASRSETVPGHVVGVGALVDTGLRRAPVYIAVDGDASELSAGMFARANIYDRQAQGVTLPKTAILIKDGVNSTAYVELEPGVFEAREVSVGHTFGDRVQVVAGIADGERVAVQGALLLAQVPGG